MTSRASNNGASRRLLVLFAVLIGLSSACTVVSNRHFQVDPVAGQLYLWIYKAPTWQVVALNDLPRDEMGLGCGGDEWCTLKFLRDRVDLHWTAGVPVITDYDEFFRQSNVGDFRDALDRTRGQLNCLIANRNWYPWSDAHNWTVGRADNGSCKDGELVQP